MCAGDRQTGFAAGQFSEHLRALEHLVAVFAGVDQLSHVIRDGRRVYYECVIDISRDEGRVVCVMHVYPFLGELVRQLGTGPVVAAHRAALEFAEPCYGAHPYAAYPYEVDVLVFHTSL